MVSPPFSEAALSRDGPTPSRWFVGDEPKPALDASSAIDELPVAEEGESTATGEERRDSIASSVEALDPCEAWAGVVGETPAEEGLAWCGAADVGEDMEEKLDASVVASREFQREDAEGDEDSAAFKAPGGRDAEAGRANFRGGKPLMPLSVSAGDGLGVGTDVEESLLLWCGGGVD